MARHALTRVFTRRDGSRVELDVMIDFDALAEHVARSMNQRGKSRSQICGGAVVGVMRELDAA